MVRFAQVARFETIRSHTSRCDGERGFPERLIWRGKSHPECGWHHPAGLNREKKGDWVPAFVCLSLLTSDMMWPAIWGPARILWNAIPSQTMNPTLPSFSRLSGNLSRHWDRQLMWVSPFNLGHGLKGSVWRFCRCGWWGGSGSFTSLGPWSLFNILLQC